MEQHYDSEFFIWMDVKEAVFQVLEQYLRFSFILWDTIKEKKTVAEPENMQRRNGIPGDWTDAPADLNGLVLFVERRNLVSARVPLHFKHCLQEIVCLSSFGNHKTWK